MIFDHLPLVAHSNGAIDAAEVAKALKLSEADADGLLAQFDLDQNGTATFAEYCQALCAPVNSGAGSPTGKTVAAQRGALNAVFDLLDGDGDGHIEEAEAVAIGRALGLANPNDYWAELREMDTDGDGKISRAEYLAGMAGMDAGKAQMLREELATKLANKAVQSERRMSGDGSVI